MKVNLRKLKKAAANNGQYKNFEEFKNGIKTAMAEYEKEPFGSYNWFKLYDDELFRIQWRIFNLQETDGERVTSINFEAMKIYFERTKKVAAEQIKEYGAEPGWQNNVKKFWDKASKKYYIDFYHLLDGCFMFCSRKAFFNSMERTKNFHIWTNCSVEWSEIENLLRDNIWMLGNLCEGYSKVKNVKPHSDTNKLRANYDEDKVIPNEVMALLDETSRRMNQSSDPTNVTDFVLRGTLDKDLCFDFEHACVSLKVFDGLYKCGLIK